MLVSHVLVEVMGYTAPVPTCVFCNALQRLQEFPSLLRQHFHSDADDDHILPF